MVDPTQVMVRVKANLSHLETSNLQILTTVLCPNVINLFLNIITVFFFFA